MASVLFNSLKVECELQIFKNIYQVEMVSANFFNFQHLSPLVQKRCSSTLKHQNTKELLQIIDKEIRNLIGKVVSLGPKP